MAGVKADALQLQLRDISLLRGLFESRVMSAEHAAALYFDGKNEAAKKRLQRLKAAGFIATRPRQTFEPSILFLTRAGLEVLREQGILDKYPPFDLPALDRRAQVSDFTIRHELEVMDVKAAFHAGIKKLSAFSIAEFSTWPLLHEFTAYPPGRNGREGPVRPDGFIRFHEKDANGGRFEHTFFLEVDRSTEVQDRLVNKAVCYLEYYKSGGFAVRNGAARDDYRQFPFRVLMVFKSAERRNNTAERLLQNTPPILTMVWLATTAEVLADPFGPVWITPQAYREAVAGTRFDVARARDPRSYRTQSDRETLVEQKVSKSALLS